MNPKPQNKESKFITGLSMVMMALFGYSTLMTLTLAIIFLLKSPLELLTQLDSYIGILRFIPPAIMSFLEQYYLSFAIFSLCISGMNLSASFALYKRRNWGRVYTIILMIVTMVMSIVQLFFDQFFMLSIQPSDDAIIQDVISTLNKMIHTGLIIFAATVIILHTWLVWKLLTGNIKKEFQNEH